VKVFSVKKEKILLFIYCAVLLLGIITSIGREAVPTFNMPVAKKIVVVDAGHGGWDPGKISGTGTQEKDINLSIALKLQAYLENGGSVVMMTRIEDEALGAKKAADMRNRKEIANLSKADIIVSIHQNSYPSGSVRGAQTFYFAESEKSKRLALSIQNELVDFVDPKNARSIKDNSKYFILKQTAIPAVIVECGFLTNSAERGLLTTDEYQEKIAWAIYKGIIAYFEPDGDTPMAEDLTMSQNFARLFAMR
jgi:N-acetylmuramoyl-L-alanine amidase